MQDFRSYSFKLTVNDLQKIIDDGLEVVAIINGEYYDIVKETDGSEAIIESGNFWE